MSRPVLGGPVHRISNTSNQPGSKMAIPVHAFGPSNSRSRIQVIRSAYLVTDEELKQNGGQYSVMGGSAAPMEFVDDPSDFPSEDSVFAVYVVSQDDDAYIPGGGGDEDWWGDAFSAFQAIGAPSRADALTNLVGGTDAVEVSPGAQFTWFPQTGWRWTAGANGAVNTGVVPGTNSDLCWFTTIRRITDLAGFQGMGCNISTDRYYFFMNGLSSPFINELTFGFGGYRDVVDKPIPHDQLFCFAIANRKFYLNGVDMGLEGTSITNISVPIYVGGINSNGSLSPFLQADILATAMVNGPMEEDDIVSMSDRMLALSPEKQNVWLDNSNVTVMDTSAASNDEYIADGNTATIWIDNVDQTHYAEFDLGQVYQVSDMRMYRASTADTFDMEDVEIFVSLNGVDWTSLMTFTFDQPGGESAGYHALGNQGSTRQLYFDSRYVRIEWVTANASNQARIGEIGFYV